MWVDERTTRDKNSYASTSRPKFFRLKKCPRWGSNFEAINSNESPENLLFCGHADDVCLIGRRIQNSCHS